MAAAGAWTVIPLVRQLPSSAGGNRFCCASCSLTSSFRGRSIRRFWTVRRDFYVVRNGWPVVVRASQEASTSTLLVQEVEFIWKGQGSEVLLTGDFLKWETKLTLEKISSGVFSLKQKLALGTYTYKFVVDGEWKHSPDCPVVPDGSGGFNNEVIVTDQTSKVAAKEFEDTPTTPAPQTPINSLKKPVATSPTKEKEGPEKLVPTAKPAKESVSLEKPVTGMKPAKASDNAKEGDRPSKRASPKKVVAKSIKETMSDDVIPLLTSTLSKEANITDIDITFEENQLKTSFTKGDIPYCCWAFFPDGSVEGSRGFSLTSHGSPPSTIEPFLIDEKKINAELIVFWIKKRLFAQKLLSMN